MFHRSNYRRSVGSAESFSRRMRERGFTLIELLVVIAIIGALVTILLPAVQTAREAARRATCRNHLKQLALGALLHHEQQNHFPTGGWTQRWTGDPDRGFGQGQPGGWAYNILPFIEQGSLHDLGASQTLEEKVLAIRQRDATPVPIFFCPSRRAPLVLSGTDEHPVRDHGHDKYHNALDSAWDDYGAATKYAPMDYSANDGEPTTRHCSRPIHAKTPDTWAQAADPNWEWPENVSIGGVMYYRSRIRLPQISDGSSKTYLIGERHVFSQFYNTNWVDMTAWGKDRWMHNPYARSPYEGQGLVGDSWLRRDSPLVLYGRMGRFRNTDFGSAHRESTHFAMCDGSVRAVSYATDFVLHQQMENRNDGQ